ncbi:MAG TPA: YCF48-related protein [Ktedonobacteraceae bacterium]|nr:YCF48-related protein [Ktedonobacteraceae bacterium]
MQSKTSFQRGMQIQQKHSAVCAQSLPIILWISFLLILSSCASPNNLSAITTPTSITQTSTTVTNRGMTPTDMPSPPPTMNIAPLISFRMIDTTTGWAFTKPNLYTVGGYILRTTDGGQHWQNVSPHYTTGSQYDDGEATAFFNASTAWVVTARHRVFHTTNGGQSWQETQIAPPVRGSEATQITFINAQDGWIVLTANNNNGETLAIFHTSDGGSTWTDVAQTGNEATQLPLGVDDWTVGFLNNETGWACGGYSGSPIRHVST